MKRKRPFQFAYLSALTAAAGRASPSSSSITEQDMLLVRQMIPELRQALDRARMMDPPARRTRTMLQMARALVEAEARSDPFCADTDNDRKGMYYSLYDEDWRQGRYEEALPNLSWILACAPAYPKNDDRNFERAQIAFEALAEAATSADVRLTYLTLALDVIGSAVKVLEEAGATVDEPAWVEKRRGFTERYEELLGEQ